MEADAAPAFYQHQLRTVAADAKLIGGNSFVAPLAIFDAAHGFDEATWIDVIPDTVLAVRLAGASVECCFGKSRGATTLGSAPTLQPRGTPNHFVSPGRVRYAQIFLADTLIDRVVDGLREGSVASQLLRDDLIFMQDRELNLAVEGYVSAGIFGHSALELESRAVLLVARLLRAYFGFERVETVSGGLAAWQVRRVCDSMVAAMDRGEEESSLAELAIMVGLSANHFCRAFAQSTGQPPHRWMAEQRIKRAKVLMADSRLNLTEIALAVGYTSQNTLGRAFARITGVTPSEWRRTLHG